MKRLLALFAVAAFTLLILLFITNPELLDKVWLWIIGFIGYIVVLTEKGFKAMAGAFEKSAGTTPRSPEQSFLPFVTSDQDRKAKMDHIEGEISKIERGLFTEKYNKPLPAGHHLTLWRYLDNGRATLGLLFLGENFFAYTIEETGHNGKGPGTDRIPEGIYPLRFSRDLSMATQKYREIHPWFELPLEINLPGGGHVYLLDAHISKDLHGCLLIADGVNAYNTDYIIPTSGIAFEKLYKTASSWVKEGHAIYLQILDEGWSELRKMEVAKEGL